MWWWHSNKTVFFSPGPTGKSDKDWKPVFFSSYSSFCGGTADVWALETFVKSASKPNEKTTTFSWLLPVQSLPLPNVFDKKVHTESTQLEEAYSTHRYMHCQHMLILSTWGVKHGYVERAQESVAFPISTWVGASHVHRVYHVSEWDIGMCSLLETYNMHVPYSQMEDFYRALANCSLICTSAGLLYTKHASSKQGGSDFHYNNEQQL